MKLFHKKETIVRRGAKQYNGIFLQPIAVGSVSAVVVALLLIMGLLDIRRNENNLVGFMQDQALATVGVLQRLTEDNLRSIVSTPGKTPETKTASQEEADYSKKLVIEAITELGRQIDEKWRDGDIDSDYLRNFAKDNQFWYVAVLDADGNAVHESGTLKTEILGTESLLEHPRLSTTMDILEAIRQVHGIGFIGLRRKDNSGTVVINLDKEGLRFWSLKVAVERGLSKIGEGQGLLYIHIFDQHETPLAAIGKLPGALDPPVFDHREMLRGKTPITSRKLDVGDKKVLDLMAPLIINDQVVGVVRVGMERGSMDTIIAENRLNIFIFMLLVILITLFSMWLLFHDQNRHLAGIIEMERRLEKAERLSALGQLAAGVAHEIRNPLNAISLATQRLKRNYAPADTAQAAEFQNLSEVIRDEIRRLNAIIEEFLTFSKTRRLELSNFPVTEVLQKIVSLIQEEAQTRDITIETRFRQSPAVIPMDINKLQQAFFNFIKNAMEAITGPGKITITIDKEGKNQIVVSITDTGCGMNAEEIDRIFSPEYTTKEKGLGLGIPLAMEIVRGHGGDVRVISRRDEGTTFDIILPREKPGEST